MGVSNFSVYSNFKARDGVSPVFSAMTKKATIFDKIMGKFNLTQKGLGSCIAGTAKKINEVKSN